MRILFTNNTLDRPAGTELSVFDYAVTLKQRGHEVVAFSRQLGEIADRLEQQGVTVCESLDEVPGAPDIIHGHHRWETTLAALQFPSTPVVSFCRGTLPWQEAPCLAPNVRQWVGVDEPCCELLRTRWGLSAEKVSLVANGVDMARFPERKAPPSSRLRRALVFSNYATEDNFFAVVKDACEGMDIHCEGLGNGLKNAVSDPAPILAKTDLVFAKGKAALEAMVSGCGVIVCDENGIGPLVTSETFAFVRNQSFAYEAMSEPVSEAAVRARLQSWDSEAVGEASTLAREEASLDRTVDRLEELYGSAMTEWENLEPRPGMEAFTAFTATFFSEATISFKLGRESREIWRQRNPDDAQESGTIEMNRILYALRESERKLEQLEGKLAQQHQKIAEIREKLDDARKALPRKSRGWFGRQH